MREKILELEILLIIQRAGDVIPQVVSVDISKKIKKVKNLFSQKNVYVVQKQKRIK